MAITKLKTGKYRATIQLKGIKPYSRNFSLKKNAQAWEKQQAKDIETARANGDPVARTLTLKELIRAYTTENQVGKATVINLGWWKREYGARRVLDISADTVREGLRTLRAGNAHRGDGKGKRKETSRPRSGSTLNRYKAALSACWEYGREEYKLPENPCRQVKGQPEGKWRVRFLSDDETAADGTAVDGERTRLLKACKASKWQPLYLLVMLGITTGARQGELMRLRWQDIDFPNRRAYVYKSKNGEPRVLPLTAGVIDILKTLPRPLDGSTLIFRSISDPNRPFEFRPYWNKAVESAQLVDFRFHDLRHTCASYLAQNGATLLQIADVLGHKQLEVTRRYSHLCVDHKQDLVDRVLGGLS
jgi:integrase